MTLEAFLRLPAIIRAYAGHSARFQAYRVGVLDSNGQSSDMYVNAWRDEESRFASVVVELLETQVDEDVIRRQIITSFQSECRARADELARIRGEAPRSYLTRESEIFANNQKQWFAEEKNLVKGINSILSILAGVPKT